MTLVTSRHAAYGIALFLASACGLALEIAAARLLAPYLDMSLHIWTAIISVVVAGFAAGNWIGGRLAGPAVDEIAGRRRMAFLLGITALTTLFALPLLRSLGSYASLSTSLLSVFGLTALLFLVPSVFIGTVSPLLAKMAVDVDPPAAGRTIGRMYALGVAGAILGTVAAGYLLVPVLGAIDTVLLLSFVEGALAVGFALAARPNRLAAALLTALALATGTWGLAIGAFRSTCTVESSYYCITMRPQQDPDGRVVMSLYLDRAEHSTNVRDEPAYLYWPYAHFLDEMLTARGKTAPRVFYLGGGGFTLPRALLARDPGATLVVAEIDPAVSRAARDYMWVEPNPRMEVIHGDGRLTLEELPPVPAFDAMVGDAYRNLQVPPHLVTHEFLHAIRVRLKPDGFFAMNLIDARVRPLLLFSTIKTLQLDFPVVEVWLDENEPWYARSVSYMIVAGNEPTGMDRLQAQRGPNHSWKRFSAEEIDAQMRAAHPLVLTDDYSPVERLRANYCAFRILERIGIHIAQAGRCPP